MSNFVQCAKCGLTLPRNYLVPILAKIRGQVRTLLVCTSCKQSIIKQGRQK